MGDTILFATHENGMFKFQAPSQLKLLNVYLHALTITVRDGSPFLIKVEGPASDVPGVYDTQPSHHLEEPGSNG